MYRRPLVLTIMLFLVAAALPVAAQAWRTVRPDGAGFTARFPERPETQQGTERDAQGVWTNRSWRVVSGESAYQVTVKDYSRYDVSGVPIEQVLGLMCRTAVGARTAAVRPLSGPVPGRSCEGEGDTQAHVYWSAPYLYTAVVLCPSGGCEETRQRFFRGFRLTQ